MIWPKAREEQVDVVWILLHGAPARRRILSDDDSIQFILETKSKVENKRPIIFILLLRTKHNTSYNASYIHSRTHIQNVTLGPSFGIAFGYIIWA